MRSPKSFRPQATREQELLAEFQDNEATEEHALLESVDSRLRDPYRTWAQMRDADDARAATQKSQELDPQTGRTTPRVVG